MDLKISAIPSASNLLSNKSKLKILKKRDYIL